MNDSPVIVGEITGVFGVKGWVKVFSYTEPRVNIVKYDPWLLKQGSEDWQTCRLLSGRAQGKTIVAQLEGVDSREDAHALIGTKVAIKPEQLQKLSEADFYWRDLQGLTVVDSEQQVIGKVSHLIETGSNDVMVVKKVAETGKKPVEMMVPYIPDQVIKKVDLAQGIIEVEWDDDYL